MVGGRPVPDTRIAVLAASPALEGVWIFRGCVLALRV
jgi:hypothetical protein